MTTSGGVQDEVATRLHTDAWRVACLVTSLTVPSFGIVERYTGAAGIALYVASVSIILWVGREFVASSPRAWARALAPWMVAATIAILVAVFLVVYPVVNSATPGIGSDRDDALNIATTNLLRWQHPYWQVTYLGNPITPLPGSLVLAAPFVMLLGNSAYQNFFWLGVLAVMVSRRLRGSWTALLLLWVLFLASPMVTHELLVGGDLFANSIFVMVAAVWLADTASDPRAGRVKKLTIASFLGLTLASRAPFAIVLPLLYVAIGRSASWRDARHLTGMAALVAGLLVAPLFLYDPRTFAPLHTATIFTRLGEHGLLVEGLVIIASGIVVWACARTFHASHHAGQLLTSCAAALFVPVFGGVALESFSHGRVVFAFAEYGLFFTVFGVVGSWLQLSRPRDARDEVRHSTVSLPDGREEAPRSQDS